MQYVIYDNELEAHLKFLALNASGTSATPFELAKGVISNFFEVSDYINIWEPILKQVSKILADNFKVVCGETDNDPDRIIDKSRLAKTHKRIRDDYGLFCRFISGDTSHRNYRTSTALVTPEEVQAEALMERELATHFKKQGALVIREKLQKFNKFITDTCAQYDQYFKRIVSAGGHAPSVTNLRWWLNFSIYARNKEISIENRAAILKAFMAKSLGKTTLQYTGKDNTPSNTNTQVGNLSSLTTVIRVIGLPATVLDGKTTRTRVKGDKLRPGYICSHTVSHKNGGDEIIPENSIDNSRRSSKNMSKTKRQELISFNAPLKDDALINVNKSRKVNKRTKIDMSNDTDANLFNSI